MDINITGWSFLEPLIFEKDFLHLEEISKRVGKSHSVVRKYLNDFEKKGFLEKKNIGRMAMYKINYDNLIILDVLTLVEKGKILAKKDLILKEIFYDLRKVINYSSLVLMFGSAVENIKTAGDIDILFVGNLTEEMREIIKKLEKKINKGIHLINVKNLNEVSNTLKEEIRNKHLIIQGSENLIKWLI